MLNIFHSSGSLLNLACMLMKLQLKGKPAEKTGGINEAEGA